MRPRLWTNVVSSFLAMAPAVWAQATANNTTSQSSAEIDTIVVTQVQQSVNTYHTELRANLQGLPPLYDQSVNAAFGDPAFQALIAAAQNVLLAVGAVSILNPVLLVSNSSQSSSTSTVLTPGSTTVVPVVTTYVGPVSAGVGNFGVCQSYTLGGGVQGSPSFTGCTGGAATTVNVAAGSQEVDTLNISLVTINQTATTTFTTLTTQVWDLVGIEPGNNRILPTPVTPVPPSLLLSLAGLACVGCYGAALGWRRA